MRTALRMTVCALGLAVVVPSLARAATYVVTPLKKAQKIGQVLPAALSDSGVVLGTVGILGQGTLAVETNPAFANTADHCGLSGAADNTTITAASPYSIQQFIAGSCAQDLGYVYDVAHNTTAFVTVFDTLETNVTGVSSEGLVVGTYVRSDDVFHGYYMVGGSYGSIDPPHSFGTFVNGISASNEVYGSFKTTNQGDNSSGFLLTSLIDSQIYTIIDGPNAFFTEVNGINTHDQAVGGYYPNITGQGERAFFWQNANMTQFPLTVSTSVATAVNNSGIVAGWYIDLGHKEHGFVWQPATGKVLTVDGPKNTRYIRLTAINNTGSEVTGYYAAGTKTVGFTASCTGAGCF